MSAYTKQVDFSDWIHMEVAVHDRRSWEKYFLSDILPEIVGHLRALKHLHWIHFRMSAHAEILMVCKHSHGNLPLKINRSISKALTKKRVVIKTEWFFKKRQRLHEYFGKQAVKSFKFISAFSSACTEAAMDFWKLVGCKTGIRSEVIHFLLQCSDAVLGAVKFNANQKSTFLNYYIDHFIHNNLQGHTTPAEIRSSSSGYIDQFGKLFNKFDSTPSKLEWRQTVWTLRLNLRRIFNDFEKNYSMAGWIKPESSIAYGILGRNILHQQWLRFCISNIHEMTFLSILASVYADRAKKS